jgi:hypothetical protein
VKGVGLSCAFYKKVSMRQQKSDNKEKNRLLEITKFTVPYIKELKQLPLVKSTNACILMQQLEYWFYIQKKSFYKFLAPPNSIQYAYKVGQSWTEELAVSEDEYRTAFDQIGVRYASKKEYGKAKSEGDEFRGKYYCSYFNKVSRLTHYFRNHEKVEEAIDFIEKLHKSSSKDGDSNLRESTMPIPRDEEYQFIEDEYIDSESTDTSSYNTSDSLSERELPNGKENSHSNKLSSEEKEKVNNQFEDVKEADESSFNVETGSNHNGAGDSSDEKILIPLDFEPTWDAKYQAIKKYPRKSPAEATKSLISKKRDSRTKMTIEQWHQAWEGWMSWERETVGNADLEREHLEIIDKVLNDVYDASFRCYQHLFEVWEISVYLKRNYSDFTITDAIKTLFEWDYFGRIGKYYFPWNDIKGSKEKTLELQQQIRELKLDDEPIEVYSKLPNVKSLNEIKASKEKV